MKTAIATLFMPEEATNHVLVLAIMIAGFLLMLQQRKVDVSVLVGVASWMLAPIWLNPLIDFLIGVLPDWLF